MFGPPPLITFIRRFIKLTDNLLKVLHTDIYDGKLAFLYLFGLALVLIPRQVINPFPDPPKLSFGSEDIIFIFLKLKNLNKMSKVMYLPLPLIYLWFLKYTKCDLLPHL